MRAYRAAVGACRAVLPVRRDSILIQAAPRAPTSARRRQVQADPGPVELHEDRAALDLRLERVVIGLALRVALRQAIARRLLNCPALNRCDADAA